MSNDLSSDFIESVDKMVAECFAHHALDELRDRSVCRIDDWKAAVIIMRETIRVSIAHARQQIEGRKTGTMTFDEAMHLVQTHPVMVTRPSWDIFWGIRVEEFYTENGTFETQAALMQLDNGDGVPSGDFWRYEPTEEDRAATDWMTYQSPLENWIYLWFREKE